MSTFRAVLAQLEEERTRLTSELGALARALSVLNGSSSKSVARPRKMSAAGRARIASAQRARWAKLKGKQSGTTAPMKKRRLSGAALARIRAAQKARWAKWRKRQKAA